jgi:hypothetical protein
MTAAIRGHMATFKVFENGAELILDGITNVSVNMDSSMSRSFYVGNAVGEGDQSIEGWSGSFDMEVKDDKIEKFIDALITNNLNGIGVSDYSFIVSEQYPNGTRSDYVYFDCQFSVSKTQAGLNEKVTKSITFQASGRVRV